jgi:hypothetical protein
MLGLGVHIGRSHVRFGRSPTRTPLMPCLPPCFRLDTLGGCLVRRVTDSVTGVDRIGHTFSVGNFQSLDPANSVVMTPGGRSSLPEQGCY